MKSGSSSSSSTGLAQDHGQLFGGGLDFGRELLDAFLAQLGDKCVP